MKCKLLLLALFAIVSASFAQNKSTLWNSTSKKSNLIRLEASMQLPEKTLFDLNLVNLKTNLNNAPLRNASSKVSSTVLSIPNNDGVLERFSIFENPTMDPALAARFPEIKSYIGIGIDNPTLTAYFSMSPLGFKSMVIGADRSAVFIEPISEDLSTYTVYKKADKSTTFTPFECKVINQVTTQAGETLRPNADDSTLRTFRLAVSTTGEYTAYFGGTVAGALAGINASMTRVNGVFEKDFAIRMVLIANNDAIIYTNASTDPYTTSYNSQLQSTLTSVIGEANYDIGHVFVRASNNGNAGCIGCVCVNGSKGSGFTSSTIPTGDTFDIDYVAHEIGHQFGGNHTFSMSNEGTGVNMEPGSGSTIMGYAGITAQDVQPNSDAYFHAASIQQITNNVKTKTCQINTATGNAVPTANAGLDFTIPRSTPFVLTGSGSDANGDVLSYNWEQFDNAASTATGASSAASATRTSGPTFRSYNSTATPVRYFPRIQSVLNGATTTAGTEITVEALPSVARTMNFRLTVRDNRAGGSANNSDDMIVTVNGTAGPFTVNSPNTAVSYVGGSSQTVTWSVAGTTANGVNCANVDILLSTDAGTTWSTLLAATPNDGTQGVTIPNTPGTTNRIMVKGTNHIFFDVSNTNFTITTGAAPDTVAPTAPTLSATGTTETTTNLSWSGATDNVAVTGYDVFRNGTLIGSTAATTFAVTGLLNSTTYSFTVKSKDAAGNVSPDSNTVSVTTLTPAPDTTAPNAPTLSASGTTQTTTNLSWSGATDNVAVTGYDVLRNGALIGSTTTATTFAVTGLTASTAYTFNVRAKDAAGNVSLNSNTVSVTTLTPDTTAPSAPTLSASGTTQTTTNLSWTGATDNVAVTGYDVLRNGVLIGSTTTATTFAVTGLTASTAYTFNVRAKDAAGNISLNSNTVSVTTLAVSTVTYCASRGNNTADEFINRVQLRTINNLSGNNGGYGNFTSLSTNLVRGTSNTITITPGWTSTVFSEAYRVWIDYNKDGDFLDSGEQVFNRNRTTATPISGSFTIPTTALLGTTRMRVSMKYNASPTSCEIFADGEVEDYTVNITATARFDEENSAISFNLYPNPVKGDVLNIANLDSPSTYRIFNMLGQELGSGKIENESIYVGSLKTGTFLIEVSNGNSTTTKRFIKE
jgi:chitodextrinase